MASRTFIISAQQTAQQIIDEFSLFLASVHSAIQNEIELNGEIYEENRGSWTELVQLLEKVEKGIGHVKSDIGNEQQIKT